MAALRPRRRPLARLAAALALALAFASVVGPGARPAAAADLPRWTGAIDLYRAGVFTTQKSWLWCTAAGVQIARNIVAREEDHRASAQRRYFDWMRARNRYDLPLSAGVDPVGWTAGMRHFVDARYRLVASASFDSAIRLAVTRLRLTNLPVALTVSHGNHGWILNGFAATADPAVTKDFKITSVRVTGPLYGLQSRNGYDMRPDTKLTLTQLRRFFTPWHYDPMPMIWDGTYVSIQPVPAASGQAPSATEASPSPSPSPSPPPSPNPSARPSPSPSPIPTPAVTAPAPSVGPTFDAPISAASTGSADESEPGTPVAPLALMLGGLTVGALAATLARRRNSRG